MRYLIKSIVLFIICGLFFSGCPYFFGYPYYGYEPRKPEIGQLDDSANDVLQVNEKEISIVLHESRASVYVPIEAYADLESVEVKTWFEGFEAAAPSGGASLEIDLKEGKNVAGLSMGRLSQEDVTAVRLGYEVDAGEGSGPVHGCVSVNESLSQLRLTVFTPDPITAGDSAAIRVMSTFNGKSVTDFNVEMDLVVDETILHASATSSSLGIATASIDIPDTLIGGGELSIHAASADGLSRDTTVAVTVIKRGALLLSPDKPRYQPGQTMHLRVMALQRPGMTPLAAQDVLIEIRDGKGNKVFKETVRTNSFGIASATFKLAGEVNMGTYEIRALLDEKETTERVIVEHYVLPKFSIDLALSRSYILPSVPLEGTVDLRYTFGESVAGAAVSLVLAYGDDSLITTLTSSSDENGRCRFSMDVPKLAVTDAVKLTIEATDPAGQAASKEFVVPTAQEGVKIWMVPAHDRISGEPWVVYLVARDPSGNPVRASGLAHFGHDAVEIETSDLGIAQVELPADFDASVLHVALETGEGVRGEADFDIREKDFPFGISLRTEYSQYKVGDTSNLIIEAPPTLDEVIIEVSSRGKVVCSDTAALGSGGEASLPLPVSSEMDGVMVIEGFGIDENGDLLRGRTAMYVFSMQKLTTDITLDKEVYRPGETAMLDVAVKDRNGSGIPSALGVVIVDEAVYALQSFTPTTYKRFFAQQTVSKNVSNVMGREQAEMLLEADVPLMSDQELASRAVLAANAYEQSASDIALKDVEREMEIYHATFTINNDLFVIANYFSDTSYYDGVSAGGLTQLAFEMSQEAADPWGRAYDIGIGDISYNTIEVFLTSAGPDEAMGTDDDITVDMTANR